MLASGITCDLSGPNRSCQSFDFSIRFENIVLSILPNAIFLLIWFAARLPHLLYRKKTLCRHADWLLWLRIAIPIINLVFNAALLAEQQTQLASTTTPYYHGLGDATFPAALAVSLCTCALSIFATYLERIHVTGGNFLLPTWLLLTTLFDAARLRTFVLLGLLSSHKSFFALFAVTVSLKAVSLILDTINTANSTHSMEEEEDAVTTTAPTHEKSASFMNRLGFFWLFPLLVQGSRRPLDLHSLDPLREEFDSILVKEQLLDVWQPSNSLLWACIKAFPVSLLIKPAIPRLITTAAQLGLPFVISDTIAFITSYTDGKGMQQPAEQGWALAAAFGLLFLVIAASTGQYFFAVSQASTKIRGALVTSLFEKCPKLQYAKAKEIGSGGAVNLLGTDVEKIILCIDPFHELWSGLVTIGIGSYILWLNIGLSFLAPVLYATVSLATIPLVSRNVSSRQKEWSKITDARVKMTGSIFTAIKAIKMMAWENSALEHLLHMREREIKAMKKYFRSLSAVVSLTNITSELLMLVTFVVFALVVFLSPDGHKEYSFDSQTLFTVLSTLNLISSPLLMIGQRFTILLSSLASLQRIEDFLRLQEIKEKEETQSDDEKGNKMQKGKAGSVQLDSASVRWSDEALLVLRNITVSFPSGRLSTISGPVGCGKSTLLHALLGEVPLLSGTLKGQEGAVPFVDQSCWVQESRSVRENILFFEPYDAEWYATCISATALNRDFLSWANGDERMAKGLSGGQRQRVSLARALYRSRSCSTVLLDDSFSALDVKTEKHIIKTLFDSNTGLWKQKTVILVTNNSYISESSACHLALTADGSVDSCQLRDDDVAQIRLSSEIIEQVDEFGILAEEKRKGLKQEEKIDTGMAVPQKEDGEATSLDDVEDVAESSISPKLYLLWVRQAGWIPFSVTLLFTAANIGASSGAQILLEKWAQANQLQFGSDFAAWVSGFAAIILLSALFFILFFYLWMLWVTPRASEALHRLEAKSVLGAPISFMQSRQLGQVINRFSQDLFYIDWDWPIQSINFIANSMNLISSLALMVASAPFLLIIIAACIVLSCSLRSFYIPSSRQLRRLEMAAKSPLYGTCTDLIDGISTFRAFKREEEMIKLSVQIINRSQRPYYFLYGVRRWLQTWINVVGMIINLSLVLICVGLRNTSLVTVIGVSLSRTTNISAEINQTLISWTEAEIAAVALERVSELMNTTQEKHSSTGEKSMSMVGPLDGHAPSAIQFRDYSGWYDENAATPCLDQLNLKLPQGSYIGICGRTGSGKSTLLLALAKMLAKSQGQLILNGRNVEELSLQEIRSSMIVVPQEPFILRGATVRQNLDVTGSCTDDALLWSSLEQTFLKNKVTSLDDQIDDYLFTPGQLALFALARVLVISQTQSTAKILLLDEINSSLDSVTDGQVQKIIQTAFTHLTVLSVVHRLDHISDFSHVLVLDQGRVKEFAPPTQLLGNRMSSLYKLVQARNNTTTTGWEDPAAHSL